jgi:drug/metabolite transporter (DMT)-like permease
LDELRDSPALQDCQFKRRRELLHRSACRLSTFDSEHRRCWAVNFVPSSHSRAAVVDPFVFAAVIVAAALHAAWNAVAKVGADPLLSLTLISAFGGLGGGLAIPFLGPPEPAVIPWLALGVAFHTAYRFFLAQAYAEGDLGQVYPLARGTAPLIVTAVGLFVIGERLNLAALGGMAVLSVGIVVITFKGDPRSARLGLRASGFALITSVFIAGYTVVDGMGARAGSPHTYAAWLFFLDGFAILALTCALRGKKVLTAVGHHWRAGLGGGLMSAAAYWIAIWAMSRAPIAIVAALRETSVLFAALISLIILRKLPSRGRIVGGSLILAGLIGIRLS